MKVFFYRRIVRVAFCIFVAILAMAAFADVLAGYGANDQDLYNVLAPPSAEHPLGTDSLGRDLMSRLLFGSRIALMVGVLTALLGAVVGTVVGLLSGYIGGIVQAVLMRLTDALMSIPTLVLSLIIVGALGGGVSGVIIAVGVSMFPPYIRLVNAQVVSVKQNDYITAQRAMGTGTLRVLTRHIFPNITSPLIVMMTMTMGSAIMAEAALSFLGIGITPPIPAWGSLCYDGFQYLTYMPILSIAPGFMIMLLVFSLNMIGDGLRDALDPRLRGIV